MKTICGLYEPTVSAELSLELLSSNGSHTHRRWIGGADNQPSGTSAAHTLPSVPLVFTGVIRNYDALAAEVGWTGSDSADHACELLWRLYQLRGPKGFEHIDGTFAVALLDANAQQLVLAVDRWASQSLYCCAEADHWVFASELKTLLARRTCERSLDTDAAVHLTRTKYLSLHRTLMRDVTRLGPGEYACIDKSGLQMKSYEPFQLHINAGASEERCADELREYMLEATRRLIAGHSRIGVALSGGLDSVLTLGAVRAIAPERLIHTYTVSFNRDDPVLAKAAAAARHFGTHHREMVIEPEELPATIPEMIWRMEEPVAREEMLVYDRLARCAAPEVSIVLYGHMADVLFGGMPRHRLIRTAALVPLARSGLMEFYEYTQTGEPPHTPQGKLLVGLYFRGRHAQSLSPAASSCAQTEEHLELAREQPLNHALLSAVAKPTELPAIERLHAAAGLEMGSIFHDRDVSQYAFQIPDHFKIRGRTYKYILRAAATQLVPESFAQRSKDLIRIGLNERVRRVMHEVAAELLTPDAVRSRGLFDEKDVTALATRVADGRCGEADLYNLWTLLLLEVWARTFLDPAAPRLYTLRTGASDCADEITPCPPPRGVRRTSAVDAIGGH